MVLSVDEIAKGFVRPVRDTYRHVHGPMACKRTTTMSTPIAETYAREPHYYGSTYCVHCGMHRPVKEFVWAGSIDVVGS